MGSFRARSSEADDRIVNASPERDPYPARSGDTAGSVGCQPRHGDGGLLTTPLTVPPTQPAADPSAAGFFSACVPLAPLAPRFGATDGPPPGNAKRTRVPVPSLAGSIQIR